MFYEDLVKTFGKGFVNFEEMAEQAIRERGGQCRNCSCKQNISAIKPKFVAGILNAANLSVRVVCSADIGRKWPFQKESATPAECPSFKKYQRMQQGSSPDTPDKS